MTIQKKYTQKRLHEIAKELHQLLSERQYKRVSLDDCEWLVLIINMVERTKFRSVPDCLRFAYKDMEERGVTVDYMLKYVWKEKYLPSVKD